MSPRLDLGALCLVAACQAPPAGLTRPDAPPLETVEGGSIAVPCGYEVATPFGVTAPEWSTPRFGEDPTPEQIHLGLHADAATSMVVTWRTADDTTRAGAVEYGPGDALDQREEGLTFLYYPFGTGPVRVHEAHLCGLTANTVYSYRVGDQAADGSAFWSEVSRFRTAPLPDDDAEVVVAVLGDTRKGYDVWEALLERIEASAVPDLVVFTGDAVNEGIDQRDWDKFFRRGERLLRRVPLIFAMGNHEGNAPNHYAQLALPGDEEAYGLDVGPAHVTVVNDSPADLADVNGRMASRLEEDLTASAGRPWRLVVHHRPAWSAARFHGGAEELQAAFGPILDAHAVPLVLNGHDHDYERTWPLRGGVRQDGGTTYVVSGGAGADLYEAGTGPWTAISESSHHYVVLRIRRARLELTAHRLDGSVLDELVLTP